MDYVVGFIIGYFLKDFGFYLKKVAGYEQYTYEWDTEFEEWTNDDLP